MGPGQAKYLFFSLVFILFERPAVAGIDSSNSNKLPNTPSEKTEKLTTFFFRLEQHEFESCCLLLETLSIFVSHFYIDLTLSLAIT